MASIITEDIKNSIRLYHRLGYQHSIICHLLNKRHNVRISLGYLKRKVIPKLHLNDRRGVLSTTNCDDVVTAIQTLISKKSDISTADIFCRLKVNYGFVVRRKMVRDIVNVLDPAGPALRKGNKLKRRQYISKGPNWIWHIDGYDKLTPFGICITACIDGFSRYIIWVKAGVSNKDPTKIASYFVDSVAHLSGYPHLVRADAGTENVTVAAIQTMLRSADDDSMATTSFMYGKSTHNQRIERWWGTLRHKCTDRWIDHFKELQADVQFVTGNKVHMSLVQFCYMQLFRDELKEVHQAWNHHRIRKQSQGDVVSGIPDLLYNNPELLGVDDCRNYMHPVETESEMFAFVKGQCSWENEIDEDFKTIASAVCAEHNFRHPTTIMEAKALYISLKTLVEPMFL